MAEVLIALGILATLGVMLAPMAMDGLGSKKLTYQIQGVITEINRAYTNQIRNGGLIVKGAGGTTASNILLRMNYVRIDRSGTNIQVLDAVDANTTVDSQCSNTFPCLVLQDGGYLQYGPNAFFPQVGANSLSAIVVNYDPDGSGMQPATTLFLYSQGRITSAGWADPEPTQTPLGKTNIDRPNSPTYSPIGLSNSDPEYVWGFTFENG